MKDKNNVVVCSVNFAALMRISESMKKLNYKYLNMASDDNDIKCIVFEHNTASNKKIEK